jgi:cysteinyl-tRNA synthetase
VVLPAGTRLSVAELRDLVHGDPARGIRRPPAGTAGPADGGAGAAGGSEEAARPLPEIMAAAERRFDTAAGQRDADAMVGVILGLETAITQWEADMDEDQGTEQARALLRGLIGRLGRAAQDGLADPRDRLAPAVEPLLALRATLRGAGDFAAADAIRDALAGAGLDISDTPAGTRWQPAETT